MVDSSRSSFLVIFPYNGYFLCKYLKVSEMKAEYFPPKEDLILQNEAPTDFYIVVSGALVIIFPFFLLSKIIY